MLNKMTFLYNYSKSKLRAKNVSHENIRGYLKNRRFAGNYKVQTADEINKFIYDKIKSGEPFLAGRFGANELSAIKTFDFELESRYDVVSSHMCNNAGFFPNDKQYLIKFKDLMIDSIPKADVMAVWGLPFEDYYLNKYGNKELKTTYLLDLEPWSSKTNPWSSALEGKKVLLIHPFKKTIESQYKNREDIFPGTDILPQFELKTLQAIQTSAGEEDSRFDSWFEALDFMYEEAMKIDFDIAIIGCGAYGFPLAAKIKESGKQAIHLAGATQLLFGIKGKRWEINDAFKYVQKFFNSSWVYPGDEYKPKQAQKVENGCYW